MEQLGTQENVSRPLAWNTILISRGLYMRYMTFAYIRIYKPIFGIYLNIFLLRFCVIESLLNRLRLMW